MLAIVNPSGAVLWTGTVVGSLPEADSYITVGFVTQPLVLPEPGAYDVRVHVDDHLLAVRKIRVAEWQPQRAVTD